MVVIILQIIGWLLFLLFSILCGNWLRKHAGKTQAEMTSQLTHWLFGLWIVPLCGIGFFYPGLDHYDEIIGLPSLTDYAFIRVIMILFLLAGFYLMIVSNIALRLFGKGANAFFLTKKVVEGSIYKRIRIPMSLGLYIISLGLGLLFGSTSIVLGVLFLVVPIHVFYLKYFEETELELRLGQPYMEYKHKTPFLFSRFIGK